MLRWVSGLIILVAVAACSPQRQEVVLSETGVALGEAKFLISQCPKLQIDENRLKAGLLVECLLNKANGRVCEKTMVRDFQVSVLAGIVKAGMEHGKLPVQRQCQIATSKFGRDGTRLKDLVIRK